MFRLFATDPSREAATTASPAGDGEMHFRFEINFIVDEITGPVPVVKILEIAWLEKRRYIREFLLDYHARHRHLPRALQDLGSTRIHHLHIGVIDFDQVRARAGMRSGRNKGTRIGCKRPRSRWGRWFGLG